MTYERFLELMDKKLSEEERVEFVSIPTDLLIEYGNMYLSE